MTKIPPDDILEGLYKLRIRESEKFKTVLELYDLEIHQKKLGLDYHRLKTMVKRGIEQILRIKKFEARNGNYERNAVVKNQGTKQRGQRTLGDNWHWKANGRSVLKETIAVSDTISISVEKLHHQIRLRILSCSRMSENRREPEVPVESPSGRMARITSKELAPIHSVKSGILQYVCSTSRRMDADLVKSALICTARLKNSLAKGPKRKNGDKGAVAMLKKHEQHHRTGRPVVYAHSSNTRQLGGCVFQDVESPKSSSILRKSSDIRKPIRCVKFTKAVVRHANIRDQNLSLGMICPGKPHQRNHNAPKFEDRSQEETEWQEQGAREAAWSLAKSVLKLKEKNKAAFFSSPENRCLLASNLNSRNENLLSTPARRCM